MSKPLNHRKRLFYKQRGLCFYCQTPMLLAPAPLYRKPPRRLATLDHIIPTSQGGAHAPTLNTVAACQQCNEERGTRDARLFMLEKQGFLA